MKQAAELECAAAVRELGDDKKRSKLEAKLSAAVDTLRRIYVGQVHGRLADLVDPAQR